MGAMANIFSGCMPALMTPCTNAGKPDFEALASMGRRLVDRGMRAVVYCGSMGEWPLLSDQDRIRGVAALIAANVPTVVGTGAQSSDQAAKLANHAMNAGAAGLMVIPRVLSRGTSAAAQCAHFSQVLGAAPDIPAVIYNSPYYGFETGAELFFRLRDAHSNLVGFKEFGGADSLSYAAQHITSGNPDLSLLVGVDTQVVHGIVRCGARGAITGVGNALPAPILRLVSLCERAALGDVQARCLAIELDDALRVLATFDEGPDLVLYYKRLMVLEGHPEYEKSLHPTDRLSPTQEAHLERQWSQFRQWWQNWPHATP